MTKKRMTKQRRTLLNILKDRKDHPTASELYVEVREQIPQVSLGTIYRNLNVLRDLGEVQELNINNKFKRYDGNPQQHYHFYCLECNRVYDLEGSYQEEFNRIISEKNPHRIFGHNAEFFGSCSECIEKN